MRYLTVFFMALVLFFNLQAENKGFSPISFWDSMQWARSDWNSDSDFQEDPDIKLVEKNFIQFCQIFENSPRPNYDIPPSYSSIPPIIHLIWLGSPINPEVQIAIESWKKHHQGWEINVWTDEKVKNFSWTEERLRIAFEQADTWAEKADILRLDVLYQFGGIYSDVDVLCLHPFHDLIVQNITFFSCFELNYTSSHYGEPFYIGTAVMGATKSSPLMKSCLDNCQTKLEAPHVKYLNRTATGLVSRVCQAFLQDDKENILILPCSYFYPFPWKKRDENAADFISPQTLAIHLWDNSWMK